MAHLVENMAYVGRTPWHGLGNQLACQQPLEVWMREAGMDWEILSLIPRIRRCCSAPTIRHRCR